MYKLYVPEGYKSSLTVKETQKAIKIIKDAFQNGLSSALNLDRVTAPIIVTKQSGINDDLNGVERKVGFTMKEIEGEGEVVQSLAKWKRKALYDFGYTHGEGIYTDMNAIRRDEEPDNIHSIFVDQWDWEKVISADERNFDFLFDTVKKIVKVLANAKTTLMWMYPVLKNPINENVFFISSQELEDLYPDKSPKERENIIAKKYGTVFVTQIGCKLKSGEKHDGRAPDYDDWQLNGDLIIWNEVLQSAFEVSSMGIRVNAESLKAQLIESGNEERENLPFHKNILNGTYPLTMGGGIGQSRICMLILEKAHIGEVQASIWSDKMREECKNNGINLL